jgi:RHS repeat-associated protein
MLVPNRHNSSDSYRYGFNGKELDNELKGEGNSYDFGARMLDPRVGRWFARDPLESKYPNWSTYNFSFNNPIHFKDPDGKDPVTAIAEAITSFAMSAGTDFLSSWLIGGDDPKTAFKNIAWGSATVDALSTYAISSFVNGAGTANTYAKLAKSKGGQIAIAVVKTMVANVISKYEKGEIDNLSDVDLTEELIEASFTTLLDKKMGKKADQLLNSLADSNKNLYSKLAKLKRNILADKGEVRIKADKAKVKIAIKNVKDKVNAYIDATAKKEVKKKAIIDGGKKIIEDPNKDDKKTNN